MLPGPAYLAREVAITAAFAPALYAADARSTATRPAQRSIRSFDRTNAHDRLLLKGSADLVDDVSPELLLYREGNRTTLGANLTASIGQQRRRLCRMGGRRPVEPDRQGVALWPRRPGRLPANAPSALPVDTRLHFQNDLAIGASYTTEIKITFNLEYHFHQAGFSQTDWNNWFKAGRGMTSSSPVARELWFIRAYALEQQEPISEHAIFLRADWVDAFIPSLEITGFINTDLYDGSSSRSAGRRLLPLERLDRRRARQRQSRPHAFGLRQPAAGGQHPLQSGAVFLTTGEL